MHFGGPRGMGLEAALLAKKLGHRAIVVVEKFSDTNAVHVSLAEDGSHNVEHVLEGDTVIEVLGYLGYNRGELVTRIRLSCEKALRRGDLTSKESRWLVRAFRQGLDGYTYLE